VRRSFFAEKWLLSQAEVAGEGDEQASAIVVLVLSQVQLGEPHLSIHGARKRAPERPIEFDFSTR
jgi:hypothetical protein